MAIQGQEANTEPHLRLVLPIESEEEIEGPHLRLIPKTAEVPQEEMSAGHNFYVVEGKWDEDLLPVEVLDRGAIVAKAELCFYEDGTVLDIETFTVAGRTDSEAAVGAYEQLLSHMDNGMVKWMESSPIDAAQLELDMRALPPDGWQKYVALESDRRVWYSPSSKTLKAAKETLDNDGHVIVGIKKMNQPEA